MQRHRNPANGFRSNPLGIGPAGGPGYRSYNRGGFGRGQPPPVRRIDVFMEAGKFAAEYLASKGLVPPNSGNGKWQNGNLKNQIGGAGAGGEDAVSGSGRRRFSDDGRGRRSVGSVKSPAVEVNRDREEVVNRSSSYSEKVKDEEQKVVKDGGNEEQKSVSGDQQNQSPDENADVKTPVSELKNVNASTDDVAIDDGDLEPEKPTVKEDEDLAEDNNNNNNNNNVESSNNNSSDLLTLIRFNKVPTKTRSSVTLKGSKSDPVLISGDEKKNKPEDENQEPEVKVEDDHSYEFAQGLHSRSLSFPQRSSISDHELSDGQHGYSRSFSALLDGGEKRPLEFEVDDSTEAVKKPKHWASATTNHQADDFFHISTSRDRASSQEGTPGITEEKQFFPSDFKMCDLNVMDVSGVHNNHGTNSAIGFSSVGQPKQEPVSVDFDLTMNSSCDITDRHGKGVEVIDLDCDSMQEDDDNDNDNDNDDNNSERREEAIFTDLGSFPDSMQRVSDMPQDGYGLMISELLDADIPNSSVSTGVNSMHNEMNLPNEVGLDDDSIYMSLGEIPISFVPVWDQQPSQGYNKRY
ncbi:uncharacterized protein At4g26450-like isoform X2 [Bidens hawaiensis]|uniref:uncharacterized protein At4g26450-like isoform X2 n=1 Tax=Bidens hawaiensis TaxID=980011 RepID=UPI00404A1125